jgi:Tol biopolymer transport system component
MYKSLNLVTVIILLIVLNLNPIFLSGQTAKVFEAGVLSLKDRVEFGCTFSPDGKEFYFSIEKPGRHWIIMVTKKENNHWTQPQTAAFSGKYDDLEVSISPEGKRLFFCSNRPITGNGEPKKIFWILVPGKV